MQTGHINSAVNLRGYEIRVTLRDIEPTIWRTFRVQEDITLVRLHKVLQVVMGWKDCHLHEFTFEGGSFGPPDDFDPTRVRSERGVRLTEVLPAIAGASFQYEYDFGDSWIHNLTIKDTVPSWTEQAFAVCLDGERACPPEDCGGPDGFAELLEAVRDPALPDHAEMVRWAGTTYDPERFDIERVNQRLRKLR